MHISPADYLGKPLPDLLAALKHLEPDQLDQGQIELHSATAATADPVTVRPSTLMATTVAEANLPRNHPDVDVPGVALESFLGGGGQGWVYAGRVRETGSIVAVKVLRADYVATFGGAAREAVLCSRLRHPNILRVFRAVQVGAFWVVIMELIQGKELEATPLNVQQLQSCLGQIADALGELRTKQIVHCDIKPANILLRQLDRSPVLLDFGVAWDLSVATEPLGMFGTPYYMAPEAFASTRPDPSWDAYSLGVTACSALGVRLHYAGLVPLMQAKQSGAFTEQLAEALKAKPATDLGRCILALLAPQAEQRLNALAEVQAWN